jgi:two-component system sensor histidine kinase CpxA
MRTLHLRILVTFSLALLCTAAAMMWISGSISRRTTGEFFEGSMNLQLLQASRAYESGGPSALAAYLLEVDTALKGQRYLTDARGRDLATGEGRSSLRRTEINRLGFPVARDGHFVIVMSSADGRYRFVTVAPPPISLAILLPYFLIAVLLVALLGVWLSVSIVSPLHKLANAVDRFGLGDLSARADDSRGDEIGKVALSFNDMAERIATLLTAERRLLQDVSHELRSPLARLSFAAELMKDARDPEAALSRMRREIDRLARLVGTLLEMTSAEGDPAAHKSALLPIGSLVEEIVDDCDFEAAARHVNVECSIASRSMIEGDPELLRRAIENILRNAIRYSPENSAIEVRLDDSPNGVIIRVRDYGPGVPEDMLGRIFDAFFRVEESRDGHEGGVGLGLSIVRRVVLLHHGQVRAENAIPGLRVEMLLPSRTTGAPSDTPAA